MQLLLIILCQKLVLESFKVNTTHCKSLICTVQIRLKDGNLQTYGRVEIYHNGEWGTACWDTADATVVCRQLGFYSSVKAYRSARYGPGTGPIWLSKFSCIGYEPKLTDCSQSGN